jgi:peptidoglycan/xylan/chitin deacetylase (PgdA/CDA1 family)
MKFLLPVLFISALLLMTVATMGQDTGKTEIMKYLGGRKGAVVLMFDDHIDSQKNNAVPELQKRNIKGTFYINPGIRGFQQSKFWTEEVPKMGHEYGIHTMTHRATEETLDKDLAECVKIIGKIFPNAKLFSFAIPGGDNVWLVSGPVQAEAFKKHNMVLRSAVTMFMYLGQDSAYMKKWIDGIIAKGSYDKICIHGVGGDYLSMSMPVFIDTLDYLVAKDADIWTTTDVVLYKYNFEFQTAKATMIEAKADVITIDLKSDADIKIFDQPLTLKTTVPADWTKCSVKQGDKETTIGVTDGAAKYDAVPGGGVISIKKL